MLLREKPYRLFAAMGVSVSRVRISQQTRIEAKDGG